jgi:molecular chaperone HscB
MSAHGSTAAPSLSSDYFTFFDLPRKLALDTEELQRRFYELSRRLHPDRYGGRPPEEQQYALDATALLNDAYRTLREPVRRAEYLLKQEGFDVGEQRSNNVPPELLEEVFELNMMLEELREGDESTRPQLEQERERFRRMLHRVDCDLEHEFAVYDEEPDPSVLSVIRTILNRRRYIQNLVREVERALAGEPPALAH